MTPAERRLIGTWTLVRFERLVDGQVISEPLGSEPVGQLIYQADGRMSALLMRRHREWPSDTVFVSASVAERARASLGFSGYGGSFTATDVEVRHDVEVSLYPERVGTRLVRTVAWAGPDLALSTPVVVRSGRSTWDTLTWRGM